MDNKQARETGQNQNSDTPDSAYPPTTNLNNSPGNLVIQPSEQTELPQKPIKKPRLPRLVMIVSFIFWIPFVLLVLAYSYLIYEANHGVSGTEFGGLLLAPVVLGEAMFGIGYITLLLVYVLSKYPSRFKKILSIAVIVFLVGVYGWQIVGSIQETHKINQSEKPLSDSQVLNLIDSCKVTSVQKNGNKVDLSLTSDAYYDAKGNWLWRSTTANSVNWNNFVVEVKKVKSKCGGNVDAFDNTSGPKISWVSVQQATELLQQCEIKTFNYTPSGLTNVQAPSSGTPTGIILEAHPTLSHLFIEPGEESTMIPRARGVQQHCGGPQFYHDGNYEQLQADGSWR